MRYSYCYCSKKQGEDETEWEAAERKKSHCIWVSGQKPLTEKAAAVMIVEEARKLLQEDVGLLGKCICFKSFFRLVG